MTVTTELSRSTFPWTGVETAFACAWPADKAADVKVFFRTAAGVVSEMTAGVNHNVTLADGTKLVTVLPIALPPAPGTLVVSRETPATVNEVLQDGEGYSLSIVQDLHDRAAMRSAEDRTTFARAIVLEEGAELGAGNFNLGGSGLSNVAPGTVPTDAATVGQLLDLIIASGNVPVPLAEDVGKALVALAGGLFGWGQIDKGALLDGILSADAAGLAKLADGFFSDSAEARDKFADKFLTYAKLQDVTAEVLLGRKAGVDGPVEELTPAEIRALIGSTIGQALMNAADTAAGRTAIAAAPQPQTAAGIGQFVTQTAGFGANFVLPAGGTWAWCAINYTSSATFNSGFSNGIGAGGSIAQAGISGTWTGFCQRIA